MKVFFVPSPLVLWNPWFLPRGICLHEWFVFNVDYSIGQILFYIHFWMFPCFQRMDFPASHVKLPEDRQMLCGFDCGSVPVPWWPAFPGASLAVCKCRASEESEETGWLLGICALLLQIYEKMGPLQKRVPGYPNLWYLMMGCWIIIFHIDMAWMGVSSMSGRTHRPSQRRHSNITHTHTFSACDNTPKRVPHKT